MINIIKKFVSLQIIFLFYLFLFLQIHTYFLFFLTRERLEGR